MGFFDTVFGPRNAQNAKLLREPKSKYYRLVQTLSTVFLALSGILIILDYLMPVFSGNPDLQAWVLKICLAIVAVCCGALCCLPWIYFLERGKKLAEKGEKDSPWIKWVCVGFFCAIGVCVLLWIIAVFTVHMADFAHALGIDTGDGEADSSGKPVFLTFAIIFSIQIGVGSVITASAVRYRKKHIAVRIVNYVGILLADLWASWVVGAVFTGNLLTEEGEIALPLDPTKLVLIIGILAVVAIVVSGSLLTSMVRKDRLAAFAQGDAAALSATDEDFIQGTYDKDAASAQSGKPAPAPAATVPHGTAEKLRELKQLLDDGIITQEEYEAKRKEIISRM